MKPDTLDKVLTLISRANEGELEQINLQLRLRYEALRAQRTTNALRTIKVGDEVRITNIKPRYLTGLRGKVTGLRGTKFIIDLDNPIVGRSRRFHRGIIIPATCLQKVS